MDHTSYIIFLLFYERVPVCMNTIKEKGKINKYMYERLIIDGNSVYEVDEECLKRRNVPTECRVKEAVERQIQKEKATKEG
jgi:hypothetical protein